MGFSSALIVRAYVENETLGWRNLFSEVVTFDLPLVGERIVTVDYICSIDIGSGTLQLGVENLFNRPCCL